MSIDNLDEDCKRILAVWEAAWKLSRQINGGLGDIETVARKWEVDTLMGSPPSNPHSVRQNDSGTGPSNAPDIPEFDNSDDVEAEPSADSSSMKSWRTDSSNKSDSGS